MHPTQPRPLPTRIYDHNITRNPFNWMGIWTPHGWRMHKKRWGKAKRLSVHLSGDGRTTFFPDALLHPETGRVEWQDDLHLEDDEFTDGGIYPCDPRVEYPVGRPRWAVSHTLLCYPVTDHNLYTHEYLWDMVHGHLQTHFRKHVKLEEAVTDSTDGMTVQVQHRPISQTIEGNCHYPMPNSAVRGVWTSPDKSGDNLYSTRVVQLLAQHNLVYIITPFQPVLQCHGLYKLWPEDPEPNELFDPRTGVCRGWDRLIEELRIPLDEPKCAMINPPFTQEPSKIYEGPKTVVAAKYLTVDDTHVQDVHDRVGARFDMGDVGYARDALVAHDTEGYSGYNGMCDFNLDGKIDEHDVQRMQAQVGREVRFNMMRSAYFGGNWLSTGCNYGTEHEPGPPIIADYDYGAGYDSATGVIRLHRTPGPNETVYVEYHHDAPAEPGEDNIRVHLYVEA